MRQTRLGILLVWMTALLLTACSGGATKEEIDKADRIMNSVYKAREYDRLLFLADSLDKAGSLSQVKAFYWRGYACDRVKKLRMAEFYWKTAIEAGSQTTDPEDVSYYAKSASRLASILSVAGDYEGTLKMAQPVVARLEELKADTISDYVNLLIYVCCCQSASSQSSDAFEGFKQAYQKHLDNISKTHSDAAYKDAFAGLLNIVYYCNYTKNYEHAVSWIDRFGELLGEYEHLPSTNPDFVDKQLARFDIYRAIALEGMGKKEDAANVFEAFRKTAFSKTPEGRIMANDYLTAANRWDEAADNYSSVDALLAEQTDPNTIENIRKLLLQKYQANRLAGRRDTAVAVSLQICDSLDRAFVKADQLAAEEQVKIVQMVEQKNEQDAASNRRRQLGLMGLVALVFLGFSALTVYRRLAVRKREQDYKRLKQAYAQLEGDTTQRVSEETVLRMANDVQKMVTPTILPQHEKMGLWASLVPAAGQASNLYDSLLRDEKLFFVMGDASGSDVQEIALMAAVKAQFRTALSLEDRPERIVSALNLALTGGRESGGEVALFVGVLDLPTGRLDYCCAGHIAPLVVDESIVPLPVEQQAPVGLVADSTYAAQTAELSSGTLILLYSQGVTDAVNASQQAYGQKRFLGDVLQASKLNPAPKPFVENLRDAVGRFTADTPQPKDMTLLAIRYK